MSFPDKYVQESQYAFGSGHSIIDIVMSAHKFQKKIIELCVDPY